MSSDEQTTKTKILIAARDLLEGGPSRKIRMSDIAKAAGISRQALYLHYANRAELLVAVTSWVDSQSLTLATAPDGAKTGRARLMQLIIACGNAIPQTYGVGKALLDMIDSDAEACAAWEARSATLRAQSEQAIEALARDGDLHETLTIKRATDLLGALLSLRTWEHLRLDCGWTQAEYITHIQDLARRSLLSG
ncbi:TetR/AcrR family transcriptional regulator [Tropicibacter naphthalenivorans]|uniref:DNA-binding transcriptional repressor AcrR n=1 Tax=Tropicibacter naphthalenivorans TaxID=441103 RepID=A0A0N7LYU0_9RHOB|nr:TetR/AcrR family transcriptional regulator [Tropicibacter naphthalenivorans]CUH75801.1 DNA-binding transcriptional repressor AcrR [Tropicibacter naphthalenivorans]SMC42180.1 transcriptional regulator, TetR family [Tropicibacter naphthalenivorans]